MDWDGATGEPGDGDDLGDDAGDGAGEAGDDGLVEDGVAGDDPADAGSEQFGDPGGSGEVRDGGRETEGGASGESGPDEMWELALAQAAQNARETGDLPGSLERLIGETLDPVLDWRELLSRYINDRARDDYSWSPPNKRFFAPGRDSPVPVAPEAAGGGAGHRHFRQRDRA